MRWIVQALQRCWKLSRTRAWLQHRTGSVAAVNQVDADRLMGKFVLLLGATYSSQVALMESTSPENRRAG
jgi:hypothetical protein